VAVDAWGNVYVVDYFNNRVQKFDRIGNFLMMWGWGVATGADAFENCTSICQAGISGSGDGQFTGPTGVVGDATGNVYVADWGNHRIQKFSSSGTFLTAWGTYGSGDGQFDRPDRLVVDASGNVYVTDYGNDRVQQFGNAGTYLTQWGAHGSGNGQFQSPTGLAIDSSGNIYVADSAGHRIQSFGSLSDYFIGAPEWRATPREPRDHPPGS
jgi:DNA-binding beta-propeller fold protein YncE